MTARSVRVGMLAAALSAALAGCATATTAELSLDDVASERVELLQERVDVLLGSHADYLRSRWPDVVLPENEVEAWLEPGQWQNVFGQCVDERRGEGTSRELDLATYDCEGRFPPPSLAVNEPGPIEMAWVTEYTTTVLPSCLRRSGAIAPPLLGDPVALPSGSPVPGAARSEWDPYVSARGNAADRARLQSLCPHPSELLAELPRLPSDAALSRAP